MFDTPSSDGDANGRFVTGNPAGPVARAIP
jgi:hypothetical protein